VPDKDVSIMPYCEVDGIRTFTDTEILRFYDRMSQMGFIRTIFSDGQINNRNEWLEAMKGSNNHLFVAYKGSEEAGLIWLNRIEKKKAQAHYCLFYHGPTKEKIRLCRAVLSILINQKNSRGHYLFDVLIGVTPSFNRAAIRFMQQCGWKVIGEIPNGTWSVIEQRSKPAVISYFDSSHD
jgi:hypothetical protein